MSSIWLLTEVHLPLSFTYVVVYVAHMAPAEPCEQLNRKTVKAGMLHPFFVKEKK